ncbi:MAG: FG-GAP repeat domain-containing protein [Gemmatimonadota bacterium]
MRTLPILTVITLMSLGPRPAEGQLLRRGVPVEVGAGSGELILVDLDADGHLDLVSKHLLTDRIVVHRGRGNGTFEVRHQSLVAPGGAGAIALGDADGDGLLDLAIARRDSVAESVVVVRRAASGFVDPAGARAVRSHAAQETWKPIIEFADVNGDGALDIVVGNGRRSSLEVLLGDGRGNFVFGRSIPLATRDERHEFDLGDVDGDGDLDIVDAGGIESGSAGYLRVYAGDGRGRFVAPGRRMAVQIPPAPRGTLLTDLDGDGDLDVALGHPDSLVSVLLNDGAAGFTPSAGSPFRVAGPAYGLAAADLNGDGRTDLAAATAGSVTVLVGSARGFEPAPGSPYRAGPGAYRIVAGDIDQDGRPDLLASSFEGTAATVLLAPRRRP